MNLFDRKPHLPIAIALALVWGMLVGTSALASAEETYPNKVQTHIGELNFDHSIPTKETSEKLYYEREILSILEIEV